MPFFVGKSSIGGSSILVVFVLLCLTTFAVLALVSAVSGYRLAQQVVEISDAFYYADSQAEEILVQVNYIVSNYSNYDLNIKLEEIGVTLTENIIEYSVPINDILSLNVKLEMIGTDLRILSWIMIAEYDPEIYDMGPINIWQGN